MVANLRVSRSKVAAVVAFAIRTRCEKTRQANDQMLVFPHPSTDDAAG